MSDQSIDCTKLRGLVGTSTADGHWRYLKSVEAFDLLGIPAPERPGAQRRLGQALRDLGWELTRMHIGRVLMRLWRRKAELRPPAGAGGAEP